MSPEITVVIPTRNRAAYLEVALASLAAESPEVSREVIVVDDGSADATPSVAARHGVRRLTTTRPGLNAARNAGVRAGTAALIAFLDDDVRVTPGWLVALRDGAVRYGAAAAFGGPIHAALEGPAPRSCGRERPPITTLDLGGADRPAEMVWGANFAVRRDAFDRLGPFDETIAGHGDEEDWLLALRRSGGQIIYLGAAAVEHRRTGDDARLRSLARAGYHRGRHARRSDERRGTAPPLRAEARVIAGCAWHLVRRRCPQGVIMGAVATGRWIEGARGRRRRGRR